MRPDVTLAALATSLPLSLLCASPAWWLAPAHRPLALTLSGAWLAWRLLCLDRAWAHHRAWTRNPVWQIPVTALATQAGTATHEGVYLGQAFPWTAQHTQALETALAADGALPVATDARGGHPALHAVGQGEERPLVVPWSDLTMQTLITGTNGSGKTRMLEVIASEVIRARGAVVLIDPKGDRDFLARCATEARRQGKPFALFTPAFLQQSVTMNPLDTCMTPEEVSARIRALMPSAGARPTDPFFEEYPLALIERLASAQQALGIPWTLEGLYTVSVLEHHTERLLHAYLALLGTPDRGKGLKAHIGEYRKSGVEDLIADALIEDSQRPRDHFLKITANLIPAFRGVVGGLLGPLFTIQPDGLTWGRIGSEGMVVYLSLASMLLGDIANRIGRVFLQDLIGFLGRKYAFEDPAMMQPITVLIDEMGAVTYPGFVEALNKARGANCRMVLAGQSFSDLDAAMGEVQTRRVLDNSNCRVVMRLADDTTAAQVSEGLGSCTVRLPDTGVAVSYGGVGGLSGSSRRSLLGKETPLMRPQWLMALPRGEAVVRTKGEVFKLHVPLLEPVSPAALEATGLTAMWAAMAPHAVDNPHEEEETCLYDEDC
jgi:conjugal transfer pilus assembly protein TraD